MQLLAEGAGRCTVPALGHSGHEGVRTFWDCLLLVRGWGITASCLGGARAEPSCRSPHLSVLEATWHVEEPGVGTSLLRRGRLAKRKGAAGAGAVGIMRRMAAATAALGATWPLQCGHGVAARARMMRRVSRQAATGCR